MPTIIDFSRVLSNREQAILQGFKQGSTPKASDDEEDGTSRVARVRLS
ncbi:hypothetical protein [Pseudomonas sp. CLCA07]